MVDSGLAIWKHISIWILISKEMLSEEVCKVGQWFLFIFVYFHDLVIASLCTIQYKQDNIKDSLNCVKHRMQLMGVSLKKQKLVGSRNKTRTSQYLLKRTNNSALWTIKPSRRTILICLKDNRRFCWLCSLVCQHFTVEMLPLFASDLTHETHFSTPYIRVRFNSWNTIPMCIL